MIVFLFLFPKALAAEVLLYGPLALIGGLSRAAVEYDPLFSIISEDWRMKNVFRSLSAV